ncbi:unnamed protein product [Parnassius mnemosyne]|uniref:Uncharacterized protein n=1 Tax=Parnassius mnemosyne TaxID=213953 RepID=A0AAV1LS35_9NEOP
MECFLCNSLRKDERFRPKRELIKKFTKEIYASCKSILNARIHFKHKFSDVILPESWDDEVIGYHFKCYKDFRVATKYLQYLSNEPTSTQASTQGDLSTPSTSTTTAPMEVQTEDLNTASCSNPQVATSDSRYRKNS